MAKKNPPGKTQSTFAQMVGEVRRLEHDTVVFDRPPPRLRKHTHSTDEAPPTDDFSQFDVEHNDAEEFHRNGLQTGVLRRLRRGDFPIDSEVDLHGLTITQARAHLHNFLQHTGTSRLICVRVIHGKGLSSPDGKAVLRPRVRHWLRHDARVLAFVPAQARDGGSGALYVLLRRRPG